ncbi:MAG: DUF2789 family protein [Proteobacteria bacterium]|nr:DUF2789 family protein [Pseudomonadota bacterium]MDE3208244.1 DUF2789 domain-containing protein [Pseudomonadota bacterium]
MNPPNHSMEQLFAQMGMPSDAGYIERFILDHRGLNKAVLLSEAPFWNAAQAQFLWEEAQGDADWAEIIDELNLCLHGYDGNQPKR